MLQHWNRLSEERVRFIHAYWRKRSRGRIALVEVYQSHCRATHCGMAGRARDALERLAAMGMAKRLPDFSVTYRGTARRECWELL